MKSRNLFLKIYKKVDEILTKPFFENYKKVDDRQKDRPTDIQDLRIYATSRRIKNQWQHIRMFYNYSRSLLLVCALSSSDWTKYWSTCLIRPSRYCLIHFCKRLWQWLQYRFVFVICVHFMNRFYHIQLNQINLHLDSKWLVGSPQLWSQLLNFT